MSDSSIDSSPHIHRITSPTVPEPASKTFSNCLVSGGIAYISGLTAADVVSTGEDDSTRTYEQSKQIFAKIESLLTAAHGSMADIIKLSIYVTNIRHRDKVWAARGEVFHGDFPCSTLVEISALAKPGMLVEIDALAHLSSSRVPS